MINQLSQENITEYAHDALTTDIPTGTDYTQGVKVGKTIPAKWWNWLFNAVTKRIFQARNDASDILNELKNAVTGAGITIDPTSDTQLASAAQAYAVSGVDTYVQNKKRGFFATWTTEACHGFPTFSGSDTVTIEKIEAVRGSSNRAFYLCLKQHISDPVEDRYLHYVSLDLLNWHEITAPDGAELQSADIVYFKERFFFLYSVKDVHNAQLYYSDDSASWYFSRSFSEYGVLGLRVVGNSLLMISATAQTYADVNYTSYRTTDGTNWASIGTVFRNLATTEDKISEVVNFKGSFIIGNKVSTDGLTWSVVISDWLNSAYSNTIILPDGSALMQFNEAEGAFYSWVSPSDSPVKTVSTWVLGFKGPDNLILCKDSSDDYTGLTEDGVTFTKLSILYPTTQGFEFFKTDGVYYIGAKSSSDLTTWDDVNLPVGEALPHYSGVMPYIIAGNYFSRDNCVTWTQGLCVGLPFCAVPDYISDTATCMKIVVVDNIVMRRLTFNGVNRVIGTTLYLK